MCWYRKFRIYINSKYELKLIRNKFNSLSTFKSTGSEISPKRLLVLKMLHLTTSSLCVLVKSFVRWTRETANNSIFFCNHDHLPDANDHRKSSRCWVILASHWVHLLATRVLVMGLGVLIARSLCIPVMRFRSFSQWTFGFHKRQGISWVLSFSSRTLSHVVS